MSIKTSERISRAGRVVDVDQALAQIEKGQQLAGHFPSADALDRAHRVLSGDTSIEDARAELDAKYRHG